MPLYGPPARSSNQFLKLAVSTTTANPVTQGAFGLAYTEVKFVSKVGRGGFRNYDLKEVTTNTDGGAKTHIKTQYQAEGISSIEIQVEGTDPGFLILAAMQSEAQLPRVIRYQPSGDFVGEREEYHYAYVKKITYDTGDINNAIMATIELQLTGNSQERLRP